MYYLIKSVNMTKNKSTNFQIKRYKINYHNTKINSINKQNMEFKNLLVPGGLGFIGSHTLVQILLDTQLNCIILDDLRNCFPDVLPRIKEIVSDKISSQQFDKRVQFHNVDICNQVQLDKLFKQQKQKGFPIQGIMHFAAYKAVGESFQHPLMYYENNLVGSINLFKMMEKYTECKNFIFSSSCSIYGDLDSCSQTDKKNPLSPYAQTKFTVEQMLISLTRVHPEWKVISLRYFNPCGAHKTGLLGDEPTGFPTNLFPFIQQIIMGKRQKLNIFGNDYPTPDGTCVRDYIHIVDLANAHLIALKKLKQMTKNYDAFNLGTGVGYSVYEVVKQYEQVLGQPINWAYAPRRGGDAATVFANPAKVNKQWGWKTQRTLKDMCTDSINFVKKRMMKKQ